jgi:hypothetical protein
MEQVQTQGMFKYYRQLFLGRGGLAIQQLVHVPFSINLSANFQHSHVFCILQEIGCKDEVVQFFVFTENNFLAVSFPFFFSLVHVKDSVANFHHTVHVMGIDDSGDIVFCGDFPDQFVDHK